MTGDSALLHALACPRCDRTPLEARESALYCGGCKIEFPYVGGMPWLFAEPQATLHEWRSRMHFSLRAVEQDEKNLQRALQQDSLRESTRERLEHLRAAYAEHQQRLRSILAPIDIELATAEISTYLALRTRLPQDQGLMVYYSNIHRDWAWGDEENAASIDVVLNVLGDYEPKRVLVIGAGSGRLAYDLHMQTAANMTVVFDFNPLLMLVGRALTNGESIELHEFSIAPRRMQDQAVPRTLRAPAPAREGLEFVFGDAHRLPFAPGSFDTVVTPWLVDILPESLDTFALRINALLAPEGRWINFGSLNFQEARPTLRYSLGECREILGDSGFGEPAITETVIPYMCSPASRHGRREEVVCWSAVKERKAKRAPRHEALPDWVVRGDTPVPLRESFKTLAMTTRIHAFIMSLIDGRRSLKDMAKILEEQRLMRRDEAEISLRNFLIRMIEEGRKMGD